MGVCFTLGTGQLHFLQVILDEIDAKFHQSNQKVMTFSISRNYFILAIVGRDTN